MNRFTSLAARGVRSRPLPHPIFPGSSSALDSSQLGLSSGLSRTPRPFSRSSFASAVPQPCPCLDPFHPSHGVSNIMAPDHQSQGKIKEQPLRPSPHYLRLLAWQRECSVLTNPISSSCGCPASMRFPASLALGSHGLMSWPLKSGGCEGLHSWPACLTLCALVLASQETEDPKALGKNGSHWLEGERIPNVFLD